MPVIRAAMEASPSSRSVNEPAFWQEHYASGRDGWELGRPAPPLVEYLSRERLPGSRVAVPGCGRGHDCRYLARLGYQAWGFDWAPDAVRRARELAALDGVGVTIAERDLFSLAGDHAAFFDGVFEYTCFCAIDPARRPEYVEVVAAILKPGGWLLGCFFPLREGTDGPPFPVARDEILQLLAPRFVIEETRVPGASAEGRAGLEWLVRARRREAAAAVGL
jgi:SAM-dependent methyltransferase